MEYTVLTSEYFNTKPWSGGSTTELFIFPKKATYKQQNFQFRISTATVEIEKSDFTILEGISRKLIVLKGEITLNHKEHYASQLKKLDMDAFDGGWKTTSIGKCTDFNLMTSASTKGELWAIEMKKNHFVYPTIPEHCSWFFMYVFSGKTILNLNDTSTSLKNGDLLVVHTSTQIPFKIKASEDSELVFTTISFLKKNLLSKKNA
ncbi:MAG: hypothetical protein CVU03_03030 [Bacteroidetes bacterium HGW-Bacteroidetes-2]|jgi:environmental stress-induced protein Ves|nr:MAG: hypothetical protein CVU03_03030 [Bacteroidetes bacterium HGW-Bacteroidetes-2]